MNVKMLIIAIVLVVIALVFYSLSVLTLQRKKQASPKILKFQALGLVLDCTGTLFMFNIRAGFSWSVHAFISLLALLLMALEVWFLKRYMNQEVPKWFLRFSKVSYAYWLLIFIFGSSLIR